jgi:hypothetical protein
MKRVKNLVLRSLAFLAIAYLSFVAAPAQDAPRPATQPDVKTNGRTHNLPQELVVCTGWHALCSASPDCKMNGGTADCDCLRVNETHIVQTTSIQDPLVKHLTDAKCTTAHPCKVDEAPVCQAIKSGQYTVDNTKYRWVSTYSYRGWCSLLQANLQSCDPGAPNYSGDRYWAVCDAAPCTEIENPSNPEKPLRCRCPVVADIPFVGTNGSCTGDNGGIMSSMPAQGWDFLNNTYTFYMPGYEFVHGACAPLKSDLFPPICLF